MDLKGSLSAPLRKDEAVAIMKKNPDKIPIICEKDPRCKLKDLSKHKYLINKALEVGPFASNIRSKLELPQEEALFLIVKKNGKDHALTFGETFAQVYTKYKSDDHFLHILYTSEIFWG